MQKTDIKDIAEIRCGSSVELSPDGKTAVYSVVTPDLKKNKYNTDLWKVDIKSKKTSRLTYSGNNSAFAFEDNDTLLIMTERSEDDKAKDHELKSSFYRLPLKGGEARPAFSITREAEDFKSLGDDKYLLLILSDRNRPDDLSEEDWEDWKDYHVIEEVPAWGNGRGFISGKRHTLLIYDLKTGEEKIITERDFDTEDFRAKGRYIFYYGQKFNEVIHQKNDLYRYDIKTGETLKLTDGSLQIRYFDVTDGKIVLAASDLETWGSGEESDLITMAWDGSGCEVILENETLSIGDCVVTDTIRAGRGFKAKDNKIWFMGLKGSSTDLYRFDDKGLSVEISSEMGSVSSFDTDGMTFIYCESPRMGLSRVCLIKNGKKTIIDDLNGEYLKDRYVAEPEECSFVNSDGITIEGWVMKPYGYEPGKKYPALLEIHGGPRGAYGQVFFHEMQAYASKGCFIMYCNPRGSAGYGEEFADLRGRYGEIDYNDIMEFVDECLRKYPDMDPERLGALGGSYGGFMCNWIEGHTDRFKAICSQRSVSNWLSDFGTSEIGVQFDRNELQADPWSDPAKVWEQSPLKYADHSGTPILFIHSLEDYNCFIDQGMQMFTAMKYFGVPSKMVLFEGECHNLSRTGKPRHRIRRLDEMWNWFEKYLGEER